MPEVDVAMAEIATAKMNRISYSLGNAEALNRSWSNIMGSIKRQGLPPLGKAGGSITREDVQRFAVDLLEDHLNNFLSGSEGYFPDGRKKRIDAILDGIYSSGRKRRRTLVDRLYGLKDRIYDNDQKEYFTKFIDDMINLRNDWEKRIDESVFSDPYENHPEFNPDKSYNMNHDREMVIKPDANNDIPRPPAEPLRLPLRRIRP